MASSPTRSAVALLTIPRQHGAWSVLLLGYALGVAASGRLGLESLLLLGALLCAMPARHTAALWWRLPATDQRRGALLRWALAYALVGALALGALLLVYHRWWLLPLGAVAGLAGLGLTVAERSRWDRTLAGELLGMAGLSVTVPAAAYVAQGTLAAATWGLWALTLVIYCGSVLHVRYVVREARTDPARWRRGAGLVAVGFHVAAVALAAGAGAAGLMPQLAALALVPAALRALWAVARPAPERVNIMRLGLQELAWTALFVVLAVGVYR